MKWKSKNDVTNILNILKELRDSYKECINHPNMPEKAISTYKNKISTIDTIRAMMDEEAIEECLL